MVFLNTMNLNKKLTDTDITYINDVLNSDVISLLIKTMHYILI
ncbi:Uncharacterised protein [Mesomycoplasma hyorhinis]|nr:Uncharacterised protein [Mesomycoplasma hyorhinis]